MSKREYTETLLNSVLPSSPSGKWGDELKISIILYFKLISSVLQRLT